MRGRRFDFALTIFFFACVLAAVAQNKPKPANVTGRWQISWEARIGTEHDAIQLEQIDSKLTGTFQGKLGSPKVSGSVDGKSITLRLDFPGQRPYTLVFTGIIDGDKMSGKFDIQNVVGGYDWHGENVRPSNYTWNAVRETATIQAAHASS
jgi:hypothetical protein